MWQDVEVVIVDKYYRGEYTILSYNGYGFVPIINPAAYEIIVQYNGAEYTIDGSDTYDKYKDKVGQTIMGKLEIATYDDGTVKYNIVSLE